MVKPAFAIHLAVPALVLSGLLMAERASALGDEVDYSAPYLTVENGELVTKYPAKEHLNGKAGDTASAGKVEPAEKDVWQSRRLAILIAGLVVAAVVLLVRRRRTTRQ